jgi:hypothetical protein
MPIKSPRIYTKLIAPSLTTKTHLMVQKPTTYKHGQKNNLSTLMEKKGKLGE